MASAARAAKARRDTLAAKWRELCVPFINEFLALGLEIEKPTPKSDG